MIDQKITVARLVVKGIFPDQRIEHEVQASPSSMMRIEFRVGDEKMWTFLDPRAPLSEIAEWVRADALAFKDKWEERHERERG